MWRDADAFFSDENDIKNLIKENADKDFIFSKDLGNRNINTGVFIVKSTEYSLKFLEKWAYDEELYQKYKNSGWWDQAALCDLYSKNTLEIQENSIAFLTMGLFNILILLTLILENQFRLSFITLEGVSKTG